MTQQKMERYFFLILMIISLVGPSLAMASVESSLGNLESKLTHVILPTFSIVGILFAAFSFITGHENAKRHIFYAICGTCIGFGAKAISEFISTVVR